MSDPTTPAEPTETADADATGSSGSAGSTDPARADLGELLDPRTLPRHSQAGVLGVAALVVLPLVLPSIAVLKLTTALFFVTFVMSWDFVSGYTGQISFGHALFFGVGGYASGLLNVYFGVSPLLTVFVGAALAALAGVLIGLPALRLEGPYLALITLIAPLIMLRGVVYFAAYTGGETGLIGASRTPSDAFGAATLVDGLFANYFLAFAVFLFALIVFVAITRADAGSVFTAIRTDADAVSAAGLNPARFKLFAFVVSGAVGGLAGAVFVHSTQGSVSPSQILSLTVSIEVIIAAVLGGMGTVTGAAVGGFFFFFLREFLRGIETVIPVLGVPVSELDLLVFSLVTLGFLFFLPEGLVPRAVAAVRARRDGEVTDAVADGGRTPLSATLAAARESLGALADEDGGEDR